MQDANTDEKEPVEETTLHIYESDPDSSSESSESLSAAETSLQSEAGEIDGDETNCSGRPNEESSEDADGESLEDAMVFLEQLESRHNDVLEQLNELNTKIEDVLESYLKQRAERLGLPQSSSEEAA